MATLHIRNVPAELDDELTRVAAAHGESKNRRAITVLRRGLGLDQTERSALVEDIRRNRVAVDADVAAMLREGRPGDDE